MTGPMPPDLSPDIHVCMAGTVTTTSPLTITRYVEKGLRPTNVSEGLAKFPNHLVRIGENRFERRPMLPGDHLKGVLRDAAFWTVYDAIEEVHDGDAREYFNLDDTNRLMRGGRRGSATTSPDAAAQARDRRRVNPIAGLFGEAEGNFVRGCLSLQHVSAPFRLSAETMDCSEPSRTDPFQRDPQIYAFFGEQVAQDHAALMTDTKAGAKLRVAEEVALGECGKLRKMLRDGALGASAREGVEQRLAVAQAALDVAEKARSAHKVEMEGKSGLARTLPPVYAIPALTEMTSTIRLNGCFMVELGLLLAALKRFSLNPRTGGHEARGHGYLSMRYDIFMRARRMPAFVHAGSIRIGPAEPAAGAADPMDPFGITLSEGAPGHMLQQALDAWSDAKQAVLDPGRFTWLVSSPGSGAPPEAAS